MPRTKKSLGQHFLRSEKALRQIVEAGDLNRDDKVLEIGPGEGVLTVRLLLSAGQVVAVEKDDDLYTSLCDKFSRDISAGRLKLVHGDIIDFDPSSEGLQAGKYKLISNIPYNITGKIIRKFLSAQAMPERMILLVQKEVAERIIGIKKESILSIAVKAYSKPRIVDTVKAGSFVPAPRVDSAIVAIEAISKAFFDKFGEEKFFNLIHAGFSSKRKKLSSNLGVICGKERAEKALKSAGLGENVRAEDVRIEEWQQIVEALKDIDVQEK